jgi:hypothetical protein
MIPWRGVDAMGDRFADLAEVRDAQGTAGAFVFDPATEDGEFVAGVEAVGTPVTWGADSGATAYVDRERVWLDGFISTTGGSGALGTIPAGKRPAATVYLPAVFGNDLGGTAAYETGSISITSAGVVTLTSTVSLTGGISTFLAGLSFPVAP